LHSSTSTVLYKSDWNSAFLTVSSTSRETSDQKIKVPLCLVVIGLMVAAYLFYIFLNVLQSGRITSCEDEEVQRALQEQGFI
jgi:hypothetical protein